VAIQQNQTMVNQKGRGHVTCKHTRTQNSCYSGNDSQYPQMHTRKCHSVSV